jgi:hypothetical protein
MQQHALDGIGGKRSRELVAPSEVVDRHRASHLATPPMSRNPVLEDEVDPRREQYHAVGYDRCAAAMQLADEVRDVVQLNSRAPLRKRGFARDGLQQQCAQCCVIAPHQRYSPRGLPAPKRRRLRGPEFRVRCELEHSGATIGASAANHQRGVAAPNSLTNHQLPARCQVSDCFGEPLPPRLDSRAKSSQQTTTSRLKRRRGEVHATTMPQAIPLEVRGIAATSGSFSLGSWSVGLSAVVAGAGAGLVPASPERPAQPVDGVSGGSGQQRGEQLLGLVAGQGRDHQEGLGEHGQGRPAVQGVPAAELMLVQVGSERLARLWPRQLPGVEEPADQSAGSGPPRSE